MASLLDRMRSNRATVKQGSTGLTETSKEELQSLASQAGMPTTPSSPLSAEGIGANADQAKMVGTPQANTSAIRLATREDSQLSTAQRQEQARTAASTEEQQKQLDALKLDGFGSLGDRVQQLATSMLNGQTQSQGAALTVDAAKVESALAPGADQAETTDLLSKVGNNTITNDELAKLAANLGITNAADVGQLKDTIKNNFLAQSDQVQAYTAQTIGDTVMVNQLSPTQLGELGFASMEDMAAALGTDAAALQGMNLAQLQQQFGANRLENYASAQRAQKVLADPSTSRAERQQALKELRELGATGVRSAESKVAALEEQVKNADVVTFAGQEYTVKDLLNDDTIKGMVAAYLADPSIEAKLKESEPGFADWIETNKEALAQAAADVDAKQEEFAQIQLTNLDAKNTPFGSVNDDAIRALMPDYGKITGSLQVKPEVLKTIENQEYGADQAAEMLNTINTLADIDPSFAAQFGSLSKDDMAALGLTSAAGVKDYRDYVQTMDQLNRVDDSSIYNTLFGLDAQPLANNVQSAATAQLFGVNTNTPGLDVLDSNRDGYLDTPAQLKASFQRMNGIGPDGKPLSLQDMLAAGAKANSFTSGSELFAKSQQAVGEASKNDLYNKFGNYFTGKNPDPSMDKKIAETISSGDPLRIKDVERLVNTVAIPEFQKNTLRNAMTKASQEIANSVITASFGKPKAQWEGMIGTLNSGQGGQAEVSQMQKSIADVEAQMKRPEYQSGPVQEQLGHIRNFMVNAIHKQAGLDNAENMKRIFLYEGKWNAENQAKYNAYRDGVIAGTIKPQWLTRK